MFEPVRGGTRGGQAEFKWTDVSADKDREHYLGHSINAPTGRWQKNKDVHWYNRDKKDGEDERNEEIRKLKELEAEALSAALGFEPKKPSEGVTKVEGGSPSTTKDSGTRAAEKEEKRKRKEARKEEKRARKEARRAEHGKRHGSEDDRRRERYREENHRARDSRSRSPRRRSASPYSRRGHDDYHSRRRSRSPRRPIRDEPGSARDYDAAAMERERERDRRRWDANASRDRTAVELKYS